MRIHLSTIIIVGSLILHCTLPTTAIRPMLPDGRVKIEPFQPVPSVINVPVEISIATLERMINNQLPSLLYGCDTVTLGSMRNVKVKVWKSDSIKLSLVSNELYYRVPIKIWMRFSFTVGALGLSHTEYQEVEAGIVLKFRSQIVVNNDWNVATLTKSDGYEWITAPVIKVRFITLPVTPIADFILSKQHTKFGELVDDGVSSMLDIKKILQPLWNQIQKPVQLSRFPSVWLRLTPQSIAMTQFEGDGTMIKSSIGITLVAETFFGEEPSVIMRDSIPPLSVPGKIDSSFILNVYSEITYEHASDLLRSYLCGRSFRTGRKEVIIQNVILYGMEEYVIISLDFIGSYRGKVYVIGKATYYPEIATISIEELEFDVSTKNALHNTADWLFHGIILDKVQPYLRFPLREKLLESQLMVQKILCNSELVKNVFVNGTIDSLSIGDVRTTERALQAVVLAKGNMYLGIRE